jgi:hypothetical protein
MKFSLLIASSHALTHGLELLKRPWESTFRVLTGASGGESAKIITPHFTVSLSDFKV